MVAIRPPILPPIGSHLRTDLRTMSTGVARACGMVSGQHPPVAHRTASDADWDAQGRSWRLYLPDLAAQIAGGETPAIRCATGDADGILPFSRAQTANGALCASWRGALTVSRINNMLSACVGVTGRHSQRS